MTELMTDAFQFHNGSIKSALVHFDETLLGGFQFHNGSIKRRRFAVYSLHYRCVSIPQWFD